MGKKKNAQYLIHPKFCIIDNKTFSNKNIFKKNYFNITIYYGGSGNLKIFYNILKKFFNKHNLTNKIFFVLIINKFSKSKRLFYEMETKNHNLKIVENFKYLNYIIKQTDLLITSAGTSIFESSFFGTPTILIESSKNQKTDIFGFQCSKNFLVRGFISKGKN